MRLGSWLISLGVASGLAVGQQANLTVSTVVGTGVAGYNGETGLAAGGTIAFGGVASITRDSQGNWVVADTGNHRVRRLSADFSTIRTLSGTGANDVGASGPTPVTPGADTQLVEPSG